jgi:transcriptional regulator with XRE-family HTH domain
MPLGNDANIESKKNHVNGSWVYMKTIGARLKSERLRLGMNQEDFAAIGGIQRRAQLFYEQDKRSPDTAYLSAVSEIGVDIQFVITGGASETELSKEETKLLVGFRNLDSRGKTGLLALIDGLIPTTKSSGK